MRLQNYYNMLIWMSKVEHYKKVENYGLKKHKIFWNFIKMEQITKFGDIEIEKQELHQQK